MTVATLLTDFGTRDYYVAAVKGVLLSRAPRARLVDISHQVEAGNITQASFLLAATAPCFPPGTVHLAVVDPGVGSARRMLAVEAAGQLFVAPDNGLLTPWISDGRAYFIDRPDLYRPSPGQTFHGRDRFAPAAAFLLAGGRITELGAAARDPVFSPAALPRRTDHRLQGSVRHVDHYGNLVTDLPAEWLEGRFVEVRLGGHRAGRLVGCYAELEPEEVGVLVGSLGTLELSVNGGSLARRWSAKVGDPILVALSGK
ncbi:MAG: SAM-dependent chlorinase/fluorinase [Acidobacteria bacterium]|nr:SAM-dependent chlorinase/fluorinase [Acidobacteriota bacterium]